MTYGALVYLAVAYTGGPCERIRFAVTYPLEPL